MKKQSLIFPFSECSSNSASNGTTLVHFYAVVLPPEREIRSSKINSLQNKVLLSDFRFFLVSSWFFAFFSLSNEETVTYFSIFGISGIFRTKWYILTPIRGQGSRT